jgi:NADH:ubiquinone oxidoreductase subunit 5 (subunit L)/multisubunit Na+/H+ antiporter MnhA subunit
MELDDLRRQWQQQPPETLAPLDAAAITQLLAQQSDSIVERLRRSARLELYANFGLMLASLALVWLAQPLWLRVFGWVLVAIGAVCIGYLYRKLHLLRRMDDPAGNLRVHLTRLVSGLRTLIRFYYLLTLAMLPVTGIVEVLMAVSTAKRAISLTTLPGAALLVGLIVVLPALLYLPVASVTRRYLQRLYGQHLDRLEDHLRELDEHKADRAN